MKINVCNLKDTEKIAKLISKSIEKGTVICLDGDLGAGKTTLTQYIARELGINEYVTSPTFTIIKEYQGRLPLYHMDVYRIESELDMYNLGYEEYIYSDGVCVIEWANNIKEMLIKDRVNIDIQRTYDEQKRIFNFTGNGIVYEKILRELINYENSCN